MVVATGLAFAPAVGAVSLSPTDWASEVTSVDPPTDVVTLDIIGGDALAALHVEPGHQVMVRGYENEPYLRVDPDGSVWENVRAPSCSLNRSTDASGPVDPAADADAEPEWRRIGGDGVARWHDHRVHPMPGVTDDLDWTIALTVDGSSVRMHGRLAKQSSPSPLPWYLLGAAVAIAVVTIGRRSPSTTARVAAFGAALGGAVISVADAVTTPTGLDPRWLPVVVTVIAFVIAVAVNLVHGRLGHRVTLWSCGATLALSAGWVAWSLPALSAAIVPGAFTATITRAVIAIVAGLVIAGGGLLVLSGGLEDRRSGAQADSA